VERSILADALGVTCKLRDVIQLAKMSEIGYTCEISVRVCQTNKSYRQKKVISHLRYSFNCVPGGPRKENAFHSVSAISESM
jgi:hypothetical protein